MTTRVRQSARLVPGTPTDRYDPRDQAAFRAEVMKAFDSITERPVAPRLESMSIAEDLDDGLVVTIVGGPAVASARVLIADNEAFTSPAVEEVVSISEGETKTVDMGAALTGTDRGKRWYARATPYSAAGAGGIEGTSHEDSIWVSAAPPKVEEGFTRIGETATLTLTISDPQLRTTAVEFKVREGDGSLSASWLSSWDTSTGVAGTDAALVRREGIDAEDGKDSEIHWRLTYTDEQGNSASIGNALHTSNLQTITKTLYVPATEFVPADDTMSWEFLYESLRTRNASPDIVAYAPLIVPDGVLITEVSARMYRDSSFDTAKVQLARYEDPGVSILATLTHSTTGDQTVSTSISEDTTGERYSLRAELSSFTSPFLAIVRWFAIEYEVTTYAKTY